MVLGANTDYFGAAPGFARLRARVVPDAIVRALELRKGSADLEISSLSPDMVPVLARRPELRVSERPGNEPELSAGSTWTTRLLAGARCGRRWHMPQIARQLIRYLLHGQARIATGILPPNHWAYEPNVAQYALDAPRAETLLETAGFPRGAKGVRMHLLLKLLRKSRRE